MATEVQLIPMQELATGQAAAIRNGAIAAVVREVSRKLRISPEKLVVRDIRPKDDLDYTYASWYERTGATAAQYETMSSGTMSDRRFIGLYGVKDDTEVTNVTKIRIKVGNSIKAIWHLQNLYSNDGSRIGLSPSVVIIPQNTPYTIERYVHNATSPAQIVLKGFVVEPYGKVLSP
ncbi:MAG: hypothetical protein JRE40_02085 [Deltaproteobacteria bacterium]|nr:hypothetical protein [Deltaproteobacteria bacterium]MBW2672541.1 hypothetical protein [Deltaproteobacteria bacterium]